MSSISAWIEIAQAFANDISANRTCPECGKDGLKAEDNTVSINIGEVNRRIFCPTCKAQTLVRLRKNNLGNFEIAKTKWF